LKSEWIRSFSCIISLDNGTCELNLTGKGNKITYRRGEAKNLKRSLLAAKRTIKLFVEIWDKFRTLKKEIVKVLGKKGILKRSKVLELEEEPVMVAIVARNEMGESKEERRLVVWRKPSGK
jgi:hypothetical protein